MSNDLLTLLNTQKWVELDHLIHSIEEAQLLEAIRSNLYSKTTEKLKLDFIRATVQGADHISHKTEIFLGLVISECTKLIMLPSSSEAEPKLSDNFLKRVTDIIISQIPRLDLKRAIKICFSTLEHFEQPVSLNQHSCSVIPQLLNHLDDIKTFSSLLSSHTNCISINEPNTEDFVDDDSATTKEDRDAVNRVEAEDRGKIKAKWISSFCEIDWKENSCSRIAAMFTDIQMNKNQCDVVTNKLIKQMSKLPLDELPSVVYQLLLLTRNSKQTKIISSILTTFERLEKLANSNDSSIDKFNGQAISKKILFEVEGTALLHILFCVQQDHEWGTQIFKYAKKGMAKRLGAYSTSVETLSTFLLAIILNLSTISKFKDMSSDYVKTLLMTYSRDTVRLDQNVWARELVTPVSDNLTTVVNAIASRDSYGWETTVQQLFIISLLTIDYAYGSSSRKLYGVEESNKAISICMDVVKTIFIKHSFIQPEILKQTFIRLDEQQSSGSSLVKIVFEAIQLHPKIAFSCEKIFLSSLDSILNCSETDRAALISSIGPLMKSDASFCNSFVLMLRKVLYSRSTMIRKVAVLSIIDLIKIFCQIDSLELLESSSSNSMSVYLEAGGSHPNVRSSTSPTHLVLLELVGLLRRSFSHQFEIIALSLSKLSSVTLLKGISKTHEFLETLCRIFYTEFEKYYENTSFASPLNLKATIGLDSRPNYPLSVIYLSFFKAIFALGESDKNRGTFEKGIEIFVDVSNRLLTAELDDLDIDADIGFEYDAANSAETRSDKTLLAKIRSSYLVKQLIECLDVSIELLLLFNAKIAAFSKRSAGIIEKNKRDLNSEFCKSLFIRRNEIVQNMLSDFAQKKVSRKPFGGRNSGATSNDGDLGKLSLSAYFTILSSNPLVSSSFLLSLQTSSADGSSLSKSDLETSSGVYSFLRYTASVFNSLLNIKQRVQPKNDELQTFCNDLSKNISFVKHLIVTSHSYIKATDPSSVAGRSSQLDFPLADFASTLLASTSMVVSAYYQLFCGSGSEVSEFYAAKVKAAFQFLIEKTSKEKPVIFYICEMIQMCAQLLPSELCVSQGVITESFEMDTPDYEIFLEAVEMAKPTFVDFFALLVAYKSNTNTFIQCISADWLKDLVELHSKVSSKEKDTRRELFLLSVYSQALNAFLSIVSMIKVNQDNKVMGVNLQVIKCLSPVLALLKEMWINAAVTTKKILASPFKPINPQEFARSLELLVIFCRSVCEIVALKAPEDLDFENHEIHNNLSIVGYTDPSCVNNLLLLYSEVIYFQKSYTDYTDFPYFWGVYKGSPKEMSGGVGFSGYLSSMLKFWKHQESCVKTWGFFSKDISVLYNDESSMTQNQNSDSDSSQRVDFVITNYKVAISVISSLLSFAQNQILDCEYMVLQLLKMVDYDAEKFQSLEFHAVYLEQRICDQLNCASVVLYPLMQSQIPQAQIETLYKTLILLYKCLSHIINSKISCLNVVAEPNQVGGDGDEAEHDTEILSLPITESFTNLLLFIGSSLNPLLFNMLNSSLQFDQVEIEAEAEANEIEDSSMLKNTTSSANGSQRNTGKEKKNKLDLSVNKQKSRNILSKAGTRVKKEARLVPQLIYLQERCEHYVITLGSRAKVSLIHLFKRNVARDFKINLSSINQLTPVANSNSSRAESVEQVNAAPEDEPDYDSMLEPKGCQEGSSSDSESDGEQSEEVKQIKMTQEEFSQRMSQRVSQRVSQRISQVHESSLASRKRKAALIPSSSSRNSDSDTDSKEATFD